MGFMSGAGGNAMGANAMQHLNQFMLQNLQSLLAANPNFLTGGIPNKLLSQMWTEPAKVMSYVSFECLNIWSMVHRKLNSKLFQQMPQEEEEHDDEEMGVAETYADYWPAKCNFNFVDSCLETC